MRSRTIDWPNVVDLQQGNDVPGSVSSVWVDAGLRNLAREARSMTEAKAWNELSTEKQAAVEREVGQKAIFASAKRARASS